MRVFFRRFLFLPVYLIILLCFLLCLLADSDAVWHRLVVGCAWGPFVIAKLKTLAAGFDRDAVQFLPPDHQ